MAVQTRRFRAIGYVSLYIHILRIDHIVTHKVLGIVRYFRIFLLIQNCNFWFVAVVLVNPKSYEKSCR